MIIGQILDWKIPGGHKDSEEEAIPTREPKLYTVTAELSYRVSKGLRLGLGGWYERYTLRDLNSNDITEGVLLTNYVPGSFFLAANDHDYKAHVFYVRASYLW